MRAKSRCVESGAGPTPETADMLKGTAAAIAAMPFDMVSGQKVWPFVSV